MSKTDDPRCCRLRSRKICEEALDSFRSRVVCPFTRLTPPMRCKMQKRTVSLCGRIIERRHYHDLSQMRNGNEQLALPSVRFPGDPVS